MERFEPRGIVAALPSQIDRVEIRQGDARLAFRRLAGGAWAFDGPAGSPVPGELGAHLDAALRFLHVAAPARILDPEEYRGRSFADFGLEPPACVVSLGAGDSALATADFGALNPSQTSQYVRLLGQPTLYLMPRHVGAEWLLAADLARHALPPEAGRRDPSAPSAALLLPVSIDQVWAVELVVGGNRHVADPAQAPLIEAALRGFGESQIETRAALHASGADLDRFGLSRPTLIALLYGRDNSTPLVRVEIGAPSADGFSRYARRGHTGEVVTV